MREGHDSVHFGPIHSEGPRRFARIAVLRHIGGSATRRF
jgi:hypothetical protein